MNYADVLDVVNPDSLISKLYSNTFTDRALDCVVGIIRYANVDQFTGMTWGSRYRKINQRD